jgi:hypothetical protein
MLHHTFPYEKCLESMIEYLEQLTTTISMDSDTKGTLFSDDTGNDYYQAVLIFKIFVYNNNSNNNE